MAQSVPKKSPSGADDGLGDVALEAILRRGVVTAEGCVLGHMIDHHQLAAVADLVADGGVDARLAARLQAEGDVVSDRAADPASSVTRAMAAKPMPVVRQTTSRMAAHAGDCGDGVHSSWKSCDGYDQQANIGRPLFPGIHASRDALRQSYVGRLRLTSQARRPKTRPLSGKHQGFPVPRPARGIDPRQRRCAPWGVTAWPRLIFPQENQTIERVGFV